MVKIRLARGGVKKRPFYSIIATDSRKPRDSGYIERIGYFNPVAKGQEIRLNLDEEKLNAWVGKGAQLTDRVKQLLKEIKNPEIYNQKIAKKQTEIKAKLEAKIKAETKAKAEVEAKEKLEAEAAEKIQAAEEKEKIEVEAKAKLEAEAEQTPSEVEEEKSAE